MQQKIQKLAREEVGIVVYYKSGRAIKPSRKRMAISAFLGIDASVAEELLPVKYSPLSYNFRFGDGSLRTGMGFNKAKLPVLGDSSITHESPVSEVKLIGIWLYRRYDSENGRDDRLILKGEDGSFYETKLYELDTLRAIGGITTQGKVCTANYRLNGTDVLLVSSEYGGLWIYDGVNTPYLVENSPAITSMCVHYERLFATTGGEKNQVWFSDDFDPSNWNVSMTEGGFIEFSDDSGAANKVISFLDYIYIFRDYGINRLTAYGDQSEFNMTKLFVSSGKIYPETVAICGDIVIFLAEDGLYSFDGASVDRILNNVNPMFSAEKSCCRAAVLAGKYYLACPLNYNDGKKIMAEREIGKRNNTLLEYDIIRGTVNLMRGADICALLPVNSENASLLLGLFNKGNCYEIGRLDYSGAFFGSPLPKYWRTAESDLGIKGSRVILRELHVTAREDAKVIVSADGCEKEYSIRGSKSAIRIKVNETGTRFYFCICSDTAAADIASPVAVFDAV